VCASGVASDCHNNMAGRLNLFEESNQPTCCGMPIQPPDRKRVFFLVVVSIEILVILGLTSWTIQEIHFPLTDDTRYALSYALVIIINCLFNLYFVFHGVLRERREELWAFFVASLLVLAYTAYQYFVSCGDSECLARFILSAILQPFNIGFGLYIIDGMAWLAYRIGGADQHVQALYSQHCAFISICKVDFQCATTLVILGSCSRVLSENAVILSVLGLWISVWWLVLASYASRHEHGLLMALFFLGATLEPAYIIAKMIDISNDWAKYESLTSYPLLVLGAVALALRVVVVALGHRVYRAFGKGLKPHLLNEPQAASLLPH
jgi:hypothetical protein